MRSPMISIVTISYNQGRFLEKAIRSVLDQGYRNLEYIVIDGGSTDESVSIIKKYERHLAYWVSERDRGQSHALNKGFARCTGPIMGWLNSDDFFLPGAFEKFEKAWRLNPGAGAWVGDAHLVDPTGTVLKTQQPGRVDRVSIADWEVNGFQQPACLFSKTAWEAAGPIDEALFIAMDFDLWLKIAKTHSFVRIPAVLAGATIHPSAKTQAFDNLKHVESWMVLMRQGFEEMAKKRMLNKLEAAEGMERKVEKLTNLPIYPFIRPLVKSFLKSNSKVRSAAGC
ncbi:MAG: glycosyltransferase family 2 protein [Kiritimatiellia bacterium]